MQRRRIVTDPLRVMVVAEDVTLRVEIGSWIDREPDCAVILSRRDLGPAFRDMVSVGVDLLLIDTATAVRDLEVLGTLSRRQPALPVLMVYPDWPTGPVVTRFGAAGYEADVGHGPGALRFAVLSAIRQHSGRTDWCGAPPERPAPLPARWSESYVLNA